MNQVVPSFHRPANSMIGSVPWCDLVFHPAPPGQTVTDPRTGQELRLDGWWKTHHGRVLHVALSMPGSILRTAHELPV